jgi:phosphoribosylpyrophosphate synthetase
MILAYKERGRTALARPLAACLAAVAEEALAHLPQTRASAAGPPRTVAGVPEVTSVTGKVFAGESVVLIPVPSSFASRRRRGHDPVSVMAALCARELAARGWPVISAPVLALRRRMADQAGLSSTQRAANLAGAYRVTSCPPRALYVLVDDVVTTGATLAEAARALERAGSPALLAVTLAATRLRGACTP